MNYSVKNFNTINHDENEKVENAQNEQSLEDSKE